MAGGLLWVFLGFAGLFGFFFKSPENKIQKIYLVWKKKVAVDQRAREATRSQVFYTV